MAYGEACKIATVTVGWMTERRIWLLFLRRLPGNDMQVDLQDSNEEKGAAVSH